MKTVTTAQMRELDSRTIAEFGVPGELLMERAGRGVARAVLDLARMSRLRAPSVLCVAGRGNNGGDAFAAARLLAEQGVDVELWLAGRGDDVGGDARAHLGRMKDAGLSPRELPDESGWTAALADPPRCDIAVDGLLGTGISGPPRGAAAAAIRFINALSARGFVVAIDVPSGMDADTGEGAGDAVTADVTVTMGLPKAGFVSPAGIERCGSVQVTDIGIPPQLVEGVSSAVEVVAAPDVAAFFARRPRASHKGSFGHALIVGGSAGCSGAIALAARAALRSGAGLVTVFTPASVAGVVAGLVPEAMVRGMPETAAGSLAAGFWTRSNRDIDAFDAILLGPGMSAHDDTRAAVLDAVRRSKVPLVLDADALNVQRCEEYLLKGAGCPIAITPHPGELSRFTGQEVAAIQADRLKAAAGAAAATNAIVVLKGAGTVITARGRVPAVNMTGNPGMAAGGMGDVLAGILAGLLAQGMKPFDGARAAVYLHGRAGDRAAFRLSQAGLVAGDVIDELPRAFRELCAR